MKILLKKHENILNHEIVLEASKSECNRVLMINALAKGNNQIKNISNARDSQIMNHLLQNNPVLWDVKDAGTTMRFLTAFLAVTTTEKIITGTPRMQKRPIGPLVHALKTLGASIEYVNHEGYPPLKIKKIKTQLTNEINIPGNISSQYISALLMIAPCLPKGLRIHMTSKIYSKPYIDMTINLMKKFGIVANWNGISTIDIPNGDYQPIHYNIEGDWSGASYWFCFMALSPHQNGSIALKGLRKNSSQGDQKIVEIMEEMGIKTTFEKEGIKLTQVPHFNKIMEYDFKDCPDLAQTVMVAAAGKGITLTMTGLESLKIKETNRIQAMKTELSKIGASLTEKNQQWTLIPAKTLPKNVEIFTYEDHRMAMAFSPLCQLMEVSIQNPKVVEKSYPKFWNDIEKIGVTAKTLHR